MENLIQSLQKLGEASMYEEQASVFLAATNTTLEIKYIGNDFFFPDDNETRDIYRFTLTRNGKIYSGKFGQSLQKSSQQKGKYGYGKAGKKPTPYEILACLSATEYQGIDDFAEEMGITKPSIVLETWNRVQEQNTGLRALYDEFELQALSEIC